eukprot:PhM_4_TR18012/c0_g1_i3/m.48785
MHQKKLVFFLCRFFKMNPFIPDIVNIILCFCARNAVFSLRCVNSTFDDVCRHHDDAWRRVFKAHVGDHPLSLAMITEMLNACCSIESSRLVSSSCQWYNNCIMLCVPSTTRSGVGTHPLAQKVPIEKQNGSHKPTPNWFSSFLSRFNDAMTRFQSMMMMKRTRRQSLGRVVIIGPENAGQTELLQYFATRYGGGAITPVSSVLSLQAATVCVGNEYDFTIYSCEVSASDIRFPPHHLLDDCAGVVFTLNLSRDNRNEFGAIPENLHSVVNRFMTDATPMVFASAVPQQKKDNNKNLSSVLSALSRAGVVDSMRYNKIAMWFAQDYDPTSGVGMDNILQWIIQQQLEMQSYPV